jgi:hypothetical protein
MVGVGNMPQRMWLRMFDRDLIATTGKISYYDVYINIHPVPD